MSPAPRAIAPEVRAVWEAGNRVEAIRMLRERHGMGLQEAKAALESMPEACASQSMAGDAQPGAAATLGALALPPAALSALHAGDRIGAIRIVREAEHIGLKEAKEVVDAALRTQTGLQAAYEAAAANRGGGRGAVWLIVLALGALLAWFLLRRP